MKESLPAWAAFLPHARCYDHVELDQLFHISLYVLMLERCDLHLDWVKHYADQS